MSDWRNKIPHEQVESDPTKQNIITGQLHRLIKLGVLMPEASQISDTGIYVTIGLPSPTVTSKLQVGGTVAANEAEYDYELATLGQVKALAVPTLPQLKTINNESIVGTGNIVISGGVDITLGTQKNGLILVGQELSLGLATNLVSGALSDVDWNTFNSKQNALGFTPENIANKNQNNGYAGLDSTGKINPLHLPALAITDTFVVGSESEMLSLVAEVGDVAIRTDLNKSFILCVSGASTLANWQELLTSVTVDQTIIDGSTNAVSGNAVFDGLALKANLASPAFTGTPTAPTATAGTNTTQVATTAFVLANSFPNIPHLEYSLVDKTVWNNGKGNVTSNTGFGDGASASNTSGYSWVSFGREAGYLNTTGHSWTAVGETACFSNTTGAYWTAIGRQAGYNSVGGSYWTALGESAGRYTSNSSSLTIINKSTFLGCNSRALVNNSDNEIVIGADAIGAGSNTATLGNTNITNTLLRGIVSGGSFVKNSAPSTNLLLAGGGDIAQNIFALTVSPTFTGVPTAPTAITGTYSTQVATTAFVANSISFATSTFVTTNTTQVIGASKTFGIDGQGHGFTFVVGFKTKAAHFTGDAFGFGYTSADPGIGRKGNHVAVYSTGTMGFASLDTSLISSGLNNRVFKFPNQDGTFALTSNPTAISATQFNVSALNTAPASATSAGTTGEIRVTSTHIYVCIATNTWVRSALTNW